MRYGWFDDENREYVIDNPQTPTSWANYLSSDDYCGLISNNAAGYAFHRSSKTGRLLRMRFNSVPTDRPGRYIYIRDEADGDYWSASWQPVAKPLDQYQSVCRHGLGYTTFEARYRDIASRYRVFVPIDKPMEFWEVWLTNESDRSRELSLFSYAEWCFWEMSQDLTNFQYILYTCRMGFADDTVDYTLRLWPFREPKAFMTSVLPVESFETDREEFIGLYRHEGTPQAVEAGRCNGTLAIGGTPCGALQNRITLAPGATKRALFIVGVGDAKTAGQQARQRYADPAEVEREFARVREVWSDRLSSLQCRTPSGLVDSMVNVWNAYQSQTTLHWSRSASFNEAGGRDGLGYRDSHQDTLGAVHAQPKRVHQRLVELLRGQLADGSAMHHLSPLEWTQGPHNVPAPATVFSDDHLWMLLSVPAYIRETGDWSFLDEKIPYADRGEATVYEHLKQALEFSWTKKGPHGLLLGLSADWNDCLNLKGQGESLFSTELYLVALNAMIDLATRRGRAGDAEHFEPYRRAIRQAIDTHAWDGQWFLRGYLDSGRAIGSQSSEQAKIFLNCNTWAVLAEAAEPEKLRQAMDAVHQHLATENGLVLCDPAYTEHDAEIGAITTFPGGLKENGGIFCHANTWGVVAEAMLGRGERAFEYYLAYLPAAKNDSADRYTMEPYVYSQFITGKDHPHKFGRARNSWLTGTASWSYVAVTQYILGIRADYEGLRIDPCIPAAWDGFEITRRFRGASYRITVRNPRHVCKGVASLTVNGQSIEGNLVPPAPEGAEVAVEAELG